MEKQLLKIEDLALLIQTAAKLIAKLPENLQDTHHPELLALITEYNKELKLLKEDLQDYFKREEASGSPINLSLRRAYDQLKFL